MWESIQSQISLNSDVLYLRATPEYFFNYVKNDFENARRY